MRSEAPQTAFQHAPRRRGILFWSRLGLLAVPLAACNATTGDFGRPQPGAFQSSVESAIGPAIVGDKASRFALTEDEKELRARAWRFLVPDADRTAFEQLFERLHVVRLLPTHGPLDVTAFHRLLLRPEFRSLVSRYLRLREAIDADHALIYPFRLTAVHVRQADGVRDRALDHVGQLSGDDEAQAVARICENAAIIARVHRALFDRAAQYRYALEHLLIEGPEREAILVERSLGALEADLLAMGRVPGLVRSCAGIDPAVRVAISARPHGLPPKGVTGK